MAAAYTNPLETLIGHRLRRVSGSLMARLADDLMKVGLRPSEAFVLQVIEANPGVTQSVVGRLLAIQRANMAPLAAGLLARGLVRRETVDGRSQGLFTTAAGGDLARRARSLMDAHDAQILAAIDAPLRDGLRAALQALDDASPPPGD